MKNLVYALVGAGFMIACQPSDQPEISGMLTGIRVIHYWYNLFL